jgi:hypothetical protein
VAVNRRDFLLLRAGQPAVLSCERLFMRYLDAEQSEGTARLFAALAADLRRARSVRLVDTAWRAREDFDRHLIAALEAFMAAGGRVVA